MSENLSLAGQDVDLEVTESVFSPTSTTRKLAEHLSIPPGSTVLDLGCGSGPLTVLAAKMGAAKVVAVDVMPEACDLTLENVRRNGVTDRVSVLCGSLFEPVKDMTFDIIIDDVSGVADRVARISPWFPPPIPTGGEDGADLVVEVLEQARDHLRPGGRIFFPILGLSNARRIINCAQQLFADTANCLGSYKIPFCRELLDAADEMEQMKARGLIDFERMGSRFIWTLQVWTARRPA